MNILAWTVIGVAIGIVYILWFWLLPMNITHRKKEYFGYVAIFHVIIVFIAALCWSIYYLTERT